MHTHEQGAIGFYTQDEPVYKELAAAKTPFQLRQVCGQLIY